MAIVTIAGDVFSVSDAATTFSIQSISKLFACTLAFQLLGDELWKRIGRKPPGTPFNSLVQLEAERGMPRNPFINAGGTRYHRCAVPALRAGRDCDGRIHAAADGRTRDRLRFARCRVRARSFQPKSGNGAFVASFDNLEMPPELAEK